MRDVPVTGAGADGVTRKLAEDRSARLLRRVLCLRHRTARTGQGLAMRTIISKFRRLPGDQDHRPHARRPLVEGIVTK
jgi:hypothetical protein